MVDIPLCSVLQISVFTSTFKQRKRAVGLCGSLFGSLFFSVFGGKRGCFSLTKRSHLHVSHSVKQILTEPSASVVGGDVRVLTGDSCPK